jgi:hypothetical protein
LVSHLGLAISDGGKLFVLPDVFSAA